MKIGITREDLLANVGTDSHEPGILSVETCNSWDDAFASLRKRGIPITAEHEQDFISHGSTQFQWNEMVNTGVSAYLCAVQYDVRVEL